MFVALSTFGAVNGILLTSSRLFYAGANEGQMPEILTMIQIQRFTPTPAVLIMALLSMLYLCVSDIFALINYVGFATWVDIQIKYEDHEYIEFIKKMLCFSPTVKYWCCCTLPTLVTLGSTQFATPNSCTVGISNCLPNCHRLCYRRANVCQSCGNRLRYTYDSIQYSCIFRIYCVEK